MATKRLKNQLGKAYLTLAKEIMNRENYFSAKSEQWQESAKADEYGVETEMMQSGYDNLTDLVIDLGIIFDENKQG